MKIIGITILRQTSHNTWNGSDAIFDVCANEMDSIGKILRENGIEWYSLNDHSYLKSYHILNISSMDDVISIIKERYSWAITKKEKSMLTSTTHVSPSERPYPKLMKSKKFEFVILATGKEVPPGKIPGFRPTYKGMVVRGNGYQSLGTYNDCWDGDGFEDWVGELLIKQE